MQLEGAAGGNFIPSFGFLQVSNRELVSDVFPLELKESQVENSVLEKKTGDMVKLVVEGWPSG
ncbi:MAG: hypothetical protein ACK8QZ_01695 [Anaerolineales bacterium]